ncbi:MAG TPA: 2,3,4,5-tetrahydropyridine-2,6-dicarboxylate N-succinyltransferase [Candidatus Polarisedimenticolaceae bacterium]|nr:2,3,4,5-tetrahydropyridine-2,6-dicarboxylate N-succinyltransferase [Candidatus Polarisedimenticolaceae bacterium]
MTEAALEAEIVRLADQEPVDGNAARASIEALLDALEAGRLRAALPWVKRGILLAFRLGVPRAWDVPPFHFADKDTLPTQDPGKTGRGVRIVPGGSTVRRGAYLGPGVVMMPPSYVNVGAYVGERTMIDSHVLVGSCAQIGARVHLSAGVQVGGVLEPVGAQPVVVEDDAFVGGGCGLYEGSRVGRSAVLAPGVLLTRAVPLHDLVHGITIRAGADGVLAVPDRAVVVPGSRAAAGPFAREHGIALYAPVIVKYRDAKTDAAAALEEALR